MKTQLHHTPLYKEMPEEQRKALKAFNDKQEWTVQCWNCRKPVTGLLKDLHGPCPHCGKELSKRA